MFKGYAVTVYTPSAWEVDRFNNTVVKTRTPSTVSNVLISPGATTELEAGRPEGVRIVFTLHFPKTFTGSLEDCLIELPAPYGGTGVKYRVVGDPYPYMDENTPTPWHMPCEVVKVDG